MRYILILITRFNNYKNKNNCICYFLIIIGFIGANIFCATKIKDANVEDYIMVNALTIFIMAMLWLMSLLLDD